MLDSSIMSHPETNVHRSIGLFYQKNDFQVILTSYPFSLFQTYSFSVLESFSQSAPSVYLIHKNCAGFPTSAKNQQMPLLTRLIVATSHICISSTSHTRDQHFARRESFTTQSSPGYYISAQFTACGTLECGLGIVELFLRHSVFLV